MRFLLLTIFFCFSFAGSALADLPFASWDSKTFEKDGRSFTLEKVYREPLFDSVLSQSPESFRVLDANEQVVGVSGDGFTASAYCKEYNKCWVFIFDGLMPVPYKLDVDNALWEATADAPSSEIFKKDDRLSIRALGLVMLIENCPFYFILFFGIYGVSQIFGFKTLRMKAAKGEDFYDPQKEKLYNRMCIFFFVLWVATVYAGEIVFGISLYHSVILVSLALIVGHSIKVVYLEEKKKRS